MVQGGDRVVMQGWLDSLCTRFLDPVPVSDGPTKLDRLGITIVIRSLSHQLGHNANDPNTSLSVIKSLRVEITCGLVFHMKVVTTCHSLKHISLMHTEQPA